MTTTPLPLEVLVRSNEKLIKAMLALLSLKDEHFLSELKMIFAMAAQQGSEVGQVDPKVWAEIQRELALIDRLVDGGEGEDGDPPSGKVGPTPAEVH